jgi:hypothetical protein
LIHTQSHTTKVKIEPAHHSMGLDPPTRPLTTHHSEPSTPTCPTSFCVLIVKFNSDLTDSMTLQRCSLNQYNNHNQSSLHISLGSVPRGEIEGHWLSESLIVCSSPMYIFTKGLLCSRDLRCTDMSLADGGGLECRPASGRRIKSHVQEMYIVQTFGNSIGTAFSSAYPSLAPRF